MVLKEHTTGQRQRQADSIARIVKPQVAQHGDAFSALRITGPMFGRETDPFLALDHFRMSGPTFPPHAHAGFSAVTYVLPESAGGMTNRDSFGDRSLIPPGGLHWTAAGSGIVHEEVPATPGIVVEGFQIFIRQPVAQESAAPVIHHVDPDQIPVWHSADGASVRVMADGNGGNAGFETPSPLALLDIDLPIGAGFYWSAIWPKGGCAIYLSSGALRIGAQTVTAPNTVIFDRGTEEILFLATAASRFILLAGEPIDAPAFSNGPFVLSSEAALQGAIGRYRSGAMGVLN